MQLVLTANPNRAETIEKRAILSQAARSYGFDVQEYDGNTEFPFAQADAIVAIGGDGSFIRTAHVAQRYGIPLIGVQAGRVGFLTELTEETFLSHLPKLMEHDFTIRPLPMLSCRVNDGKPFLCLNDLLVYKHTFSGVTQLKIVIDEDEVGTLFGDGIVISTPTGATGYSLSAGGPIVADGLETMLITPVCPHTLHMRPIVTAVDSVIRLTVQDAAFAAADGERVALMQQGDRITVTQAEETVPLMVFERRNRFRLISQKLT